MKVAVVMPAYNAERFLSEAMESVLAQTFEDFEFIAIDDGSTDRTAEILSEYQGRDERVRIISHENWGIVRSLNDAIESTDAEWIARMDADDVMVPERLERQMAFIEANPGLGLTSCLVQYIDSQGQVLGRSDSDLVTDDAVQRVRSRGDLIIMSHPGAMIRRDVLEVVGGYRAETWPCEDVDLFNRIADAGYRVLVQPKHLLHYRIHSTSATGETLRMDGTLQTWLQRCSLNRRNGLPEPELDEFVDARDRLPVFQRMNDRRRDRASMMYRRATFAYSLGQLGTTLLLILGSSVLDPANAPSQVWRKFVRPRLAGVKDAGS